MELDEKPAIRKIYHEIFQEQIILVFLVPADMAYQGQVAYTQHRNIVREDAETTKVRPVFDASVKQKGGRSLNSYLKPGPKLNPAIMATIMRFRKKKIRWMAGIEKAFLQIKLHGDHAQLLRCLWVDNWESKDRKIVHYVWTRLAFWLTCSPFVLRAVISHHLDSKKDKYPERVKSILERLYVDDWMGGSDDLDKAVEEILWTKQVFDEARIPLVKWCTNSEELKERLRGVIEFSTKPREMNSDLTDETKKALGILWENMVSTDKMGRICHTIITPSTLKDWNQFVSGIDGIEDMRIPMI
jgi:hypothetical protein